MLAPIIHLDRVTRLYGTFAALRDVSLTIDPGTSLLLLGENGAGKSTLLKLLSGLNTPTHGTLRIFDENPHDVRERIAYMSHAPMLYDELTALENLEYFASLYTHSLGPASPALNPHQALLDVGLDPALPRRVSEYSQGMRQRTSLARVLLTNPDLLLLDEPFSNLDVTSAQAMITRLRSYLATGDRTLILTTHQHELARPLATRTITLQQGRVASDTTA